MSLEAAYLVDPYLFRRPTVGEWGLAAASILAWAPAAEAEFAISSDCIQHLIASDNYAYFNPHELHALLRSQGEASLSARELCTQASRLLERAEYPSLAEYSGQVEVDPPALVDRQSPNEIRNAFPRWLASVHAATHSARCTRPLRTASRPGDGLYAEVLATVSGAVAFGLSVLFRPPAPPLRLADLVVDPLSTLRLAYEAYVPDSDKTAYPLREFKVGPEFVSSIRDGHLDANPAVLRGIVKQTVRILSGQENRFSSLAVHPERIGPGPNDEQESRDDGAVAFRATVTVHGAGYRLHYWKRGSWYELRYVGKESD